jgi:N-acyl-L-homoserine lactone synthetase
VIKLFIFKQVETEKELKQVYKLRYKIYCVERKYLDPAYYPDQIEKDVYDKYSVHFLAFDKDGEKIVGTSRLILNSPLGFPIEKEWDMSDIQEATKNIRDQIAEISRFIVAPENRGDHLITLRLGGEMYRYCKKKKIEIVYAIMEAPILEMLIKFGFPFRIIDERKQYMGTENFPTVMIVYEMEQMLKERYPEIYKFFSPNA